MTRKVVLLTPVEEFLDLAKKVREIDPNCQIEYAENEKKLRECVQGFQSHDRLITFATPVIVPADVIQSLPTPAYNFHNGPPEYPGLFPACFAAYDGTLSFGVTLHEITEEVDQGPIVGVEMSVIAPKIKRINLEGLSRILLERLMKRMLPVVLDKILRPPRLDIQWSKKVRRKADFDALCMLPENVDRTEFERRLRAVGEGPNHALRLPVHGRMFKLEPLENAGPVMKGGKVIKPQK